MLTVEIARVLYKRQKKHCGYVDIEESPKAVLEEYEISPEGLPEDLRYNGRIDVVIRDKKQKPRILIEVKKHYKDIKADVTCIARLLHLIPPADVRYGAIAFVRNLRRNEVCTAEEAVRCECERLENVIPGIKIKMGKPSRVRRHDECGEYYCLAFCLIVRRRNG
jgi:hypothetical protein